MPCTVTQGEIDYYNGRREDGNLVQLDKVTRLLCGVMEQAAKNGWDVLKDNAELQGWWETHKRFDESRPLEVGDDVQDTKDKSVGRIVALADGLAVIQRRHSKKLNVPVSQLKRR